MILKIISILGFIIALCVPLGINMSRQENARRGEKVKKVKPRYTVLGALTSALLFIFSCSYVIIPTGYTGVRTTFGQIDSVSVRNGFNWKIPFIQSVVQVNNKQQDINFKDRIWSETKSRTAIYYENIIVTYQINPESSAWIYANVSDYKSSLINQSIVASAVKASSKTVSDSDATNRSVIEPLCAENLQKSLDEKYGEQIIFVNKVIINNADFEESYNNALAAKQQAQLEAEKQAIENQKAVEKAEADATVTRTEAEAKADAKLIQAEAESKANKLLEKSLNDKILREQWIEKWDGKLPQYVADDGNGIMIGVGSSAN